MNYNNPNPNPNPNPNLYSNASSSYNPGYGNQCSSSSQYEYEQLPEIIFDHSSYANKEKRKIKLFNGILLMLYILSLFFLPIEYYDHYKYYEHPEFYVILTSILLLLNGFILIRKFSTSWVLETLYQVLILSNLVGSCFLTTQFDSPILLIIYVSIISLNSMLLVFVNNWKIYTTM